MRRIEMDAPDAACRATSGIQPLVGDVKILLPIENDARKVRNLRHAGESSNTEFPMTHSRHIASSIPSRKRDAGLRACERRDALMLQISKRNYFGTTTID